MVYLDIGYSGFFAFLKILQCPKIDPLSLECLYCVGSAAMVDHSAKTVQSQPCIQQHARLWLLADIRILAQEALVGLWTSESSSA